VTRIICGVDIASATLIARIGRTGAWREFANSLEGISELADFCQSQGVELVAMEATGGYEKRSYVQLTEHGLGVAIVNPRAVRQFAQSMGALEKTDAIDAGMIAWYAETKQSQPLSLAPKGQLELRARVTRLRQLTAVRTAQKNQRRLVSLPAIEKSFEQMLGFLGQQIAELEHAISELIEADPLWRELDRAFRTIKGVGDRTVANMMAEMPEIGTLSNKTISKLAGLAPLANDSGNHQGKRSVRGGRGAVRDLLFIVGSVVARHEPDFIAMEKRLRTANKPPKVVRIAVAHKLLVRLNAKAREIRQLHAQKQAFVCPC
jgi:transposase